MVHLLLIVIYLAFISLGLPDSLLGSAWPSMVQDLSTNLSYAGILAAGFFSYRSLVKMTGKSGAPA